MKRIINGKMGIIIVIILIFLSGCVSTPVSEKGTISLTSSPSGSDVYLDNQYRGSTPVTIPDVVPGPHTLEYRHAGYQSWSTAITVIPGPSNYYAALVQKVVTQVPQAVTHILTPVPGQAAVTIDVGKKTMLIGESNLFSGNAVGTNHVLLTLYGPGKFSNGVSLVQQNVDGLCRWSYTWNPGSAAQSGSYNMIVSDSWKTTSARTEFAVIGGGVVSISTSSYAAAPGGSVTFSGQCTTGAQHVILGLYGPGQFASGRVFGPISVSADKTWNFPVTLDVTMPTGYYTMYIYDVPKTASGNVQFSVGYT